MISVSEHIKNLIPYVPGKPIEELERELGITGSIKLASNENPLGPSPKAIAALKKAAEGLNRYPDGSGFLLPQHDDTGRQKRYTCPGGQVVFYPAGYCASFIFNVK